MRKTCCFETSTTVLTKSILLHSCSCFILKNCLVIIINHKFYNYDCVLYLWIYPRILIFINIFKSRLRQATIFLLCLPLFLNRNQLCLFLLELYHEHFCLKIVVDETLKNIVAYRHCEKVIKTIDKSNCKSVLLCFKTLKNCHFRTIVVLYAEWSNSNNRAYFLSVCTKTIRNVLSN